VWLLRSSAVLWLLCLSQLSPAEEAGYRKNLALGREVTASSSPKLVLVQDCVLDSATGRGYILPCRGG
jgi:hypothetical protein